MNSRPRILIDFEEAFNTFTGIPLSVVNDILSLLHLDVDLFLWYHDEQKTSKILKWMNDYLSPEQKEKVTLLNSRPSNSLIWISLFLPSSFFKRTNYDYIYVRLFPRLPISGNYMTILRIDDPFGSYSSPIGNLFADILSKKGLRNSIARSLRTFGLRQLDKDKTIKIFNSKWTMKQWSEIYKDLRNQDLVIYPPVQFSIDDYFGKSKTSKKPKVTRPYFVFIGGQRQRKDPLSIIELWALNLENEIFDFILIGHIPDNLLSGAVRKAIETGRLSFRKNISNTELREILQLSRGLIFNSKGEGFGNPIAEAIYLRINLICNDLEVFKEVGGEYPFYFGTGNFHEAILILRKLSKSRLNKKKKPENLYDIQSAINRWSKVFYSN